MARFFFRRGGRDAAEADASLRVTGWVRAALALGEDDAVTVSQIACGHPECGDVETVVLVMRAGRRTEAFKLAKGIGLVSEADVAALFAAGATTP